MFNKEYSFKGVHADKVKTLTMDFDNNKNKLFMRNVDVYMLAPIVGFLYQRRSDIDNNSDTNTKVFLGQLMDNNDQLTFNFKLIMLLDKKYEPDAEKRIEKAFKGDISADDELRYEQYVRGGVDVLYEKLMENVNSANDYVIRLYDFLEEFDNRYNQTIDIDTMLSLCQKIK